MEALCISIVVTLVSYDISHSVEALGITSVVTLMSRNINHGIESLCKISVVTLVSDAGNELSAIEFKLCMYVLWRHWR